MEYVINHSECKAFIVAKDFVQMVNSIRDKLPNIPKENFIYFGDDKTPEGYRTTKPSSPRLLPKSRM